MRPRTATLLTSLLVLTGSVAYFSTPSLSQTAGQSLSEISPISATVEINPTPEQPPGNTELTSGSFSDKVSTTLLATVAEQQQQSVESLKILEVQPAEWSGCLGIYNPGQACTTINLVGFRALVSNGQTTWVYHFTADGQQIVQNTTASGAQSPILTFFTPTENDAAEEIDPQVIFKSQDSGEMLETCATILMADGTLYREQSQPGQSATRRVIGQLSSVEVSDFQQVLEAQRFPNLNKMRYLTEEVFADYPTVIFEASGSRVELVYTETEHLPESLQSVMTAWDKVSAVPELAVPGAATQNLSCEASISAGNGATLIYQVTGQINLDNTGEQIRPTEAASELSMTVKKRGRDGQMKTLLNRTTLQNFEIVAPDANYSSLPFTGSFRGLPNDGAGLYSVTASRNGLYVSLRPFQGIPPQIQVVHYLSADRSVRSTPGICRASS